MSAVVDTAEAAAIVETGKNDLLLAERFVAQHGATVRWNSTQKRWIVWDGHRWGSDFDGAVVRHMSKTISGMYAEAGDIADRTDRDDFLKFLSRSQNDSRVTAAIRRARAQLGIAVTDGVLDRDPYLLNVGNGYLDLRKRDLYEPDSSHLMTKMAGVEYDPTAMAPQWDRFIGRIFKGDQSLIGFVQRSVGYSLTGDVSEQVAFIGVGSGSNGKTTFVNVIRKLLGDYSMRTPADTLIARQRGDSSHDISRLRGARFVAVSETQVGSRLDEARLKEITGKETIVSRDHFKSNDEYEPQFHIWLMTNSLPQIRETTDGIWRRLRIIPFDAKFEGTDRDLDLEEKLLGELPGILNWALEGLRQWRAQRLDEPERLVKLRAGYRENMDVVGSFLREVVTDAPKAKLGLQELYNVYGHWAVLRREFVWKMRTFNKELRERNFVSDTNMPNGAGAWQNIGLTDYGMSLLKQIQAFPSL